MQTYGQLNLSVDLNLYTKFLLMASNHIFHLRLKKYQIILGDKIKCMPPELIEKSPKSIYLS